MKPTRPEPIPTDLPAEAREALLRGKTIEAIKMLHQQRGMSLLDAKNLIEAQAKSDPALARAVLKTREDGQRALKIAAMAIGGIVLLVLMYVVILRPVP